MIGDFTIGGSFNRASMAFFLQQGILDKCNHAVIVIRFGSALHFVSIAVVEFHFCINYFGACTIRVLHTH